MSYVTSQLRLGPDSTPRPVKTLLFLTATLTLVSALITPFFTYLNILGPQSYLALSWWGLNNFYLWQLASFLFIQPIYLQGVTFSFLITLAFNLYIIWQMGSEICNRVGNRTFLSLYFLSGIGAGLLTLLMQSAIGGYLPIAGPTSSILALILCWSFFHPEVELLLFFILPVKAKWLATGLISALLLVNLSQGIWISFFLCLFGVLIGYFFALFALDLHSPFAILNTFELKATHFFRTKLGIKKKSTKRAEIISINDDDIFVDKMLEKIAKQGQDSLTFSERQRLDTIAKNKDR